MRLQVLLREDNTKLLAKLEGLTPALCQQIEVANGDIKAAIARIGKAANSNATLSTKLALTSHLLNYITFPASEELEGLLLCSDIGSTLCHLIGAVDGAKPAQIQQESTVLSIIAIMGFLLELADISGPANLQQHGRTLFGSQVIPAVLALVANASIDPSVRRESAAVLQSYVTGCHANCHILGSRGVEQLFRSTFVGCEDAGIQMDVLEVVYRCGRARVDLESLQQVIGTPGWRQLEHLVTQAPKTLELAVELHAVMSFINRGKEARLCCIKMAALKWAKQGEKQVETEQTWVSFGLDHLSVLVINDGHEDSAELVDIAYGDLQAQCKAHGDATRWVWNLSELPESLHARWSISEGDGSLWAVETTVPTKAFDQALAAAPLVACALREHGLWAAEAGPRALKAAPGAMHCDASQRATRKISWGVSVYRELVLEPSSRSASKAAADRPVKSALKAANAEQRAGQAAARALLAAEVQSAKETVAESAKETVAVSAKETVTVPAKKTAVLPAKKAAALPAEKAAALPAKKAVTPPTKETVTLPSKAAITPAGKENVPPPHEDAAPPPPPAAKNKPAARGASRTPLGALLGGEAKGPRRKEAPRKKGEEPRGSKAAPVTAQEERRTGADKVGKATPPAASQPLPDLVSPSLVTPSPGLARLGRLGAAAAWTSPRSALGPALEGASVVGEGALRALKRTPLASEARGSCLGVASCRAPLKARARGGEEEPASKRARLEEAGGVGGGAGDGVGPRGARPELRAVSGESADTLGSEGSDLNGDVPRLQAMLAGILRQRRAAAVARHGARLEALTAEVRRAAEAEQAAAQAVAERLARETGGRLEALAAAKQRKMEDIERLTEDYRAAVEARWEEYRALHSECAGVAQQARERAGEARAELGARAAKLEAQARAALEEERERGEAAKRRAARLPELAGLLARLV